MTEEEHVIWNALAQFVENNADAIENMFDDDPERPRLEREQAIAERLCAEFDANVAAVAG